MINRSNFTESEASFAFFSKNGQLEQLQTGYRDPVGCGGGDEEGVVTWCSAPYFQLFRVAVLGDG